jgi:hypothetical protein
MDIPAIEPILCRCCGLVTAPTQTLRGLVPSCIRCTGHWAQAIRCGGVHGDALQREALQLWKVGMWAPWYVVAVLATDDAHLANRLLVDVGGGKVPPVSLRVEQPPRLWEVVLARALCAGTIPSHEEVVEACILPFAGWPNTEATRAAIAGELRRAIGAAVGEVVELDIEVMPEPGHAGGFVATVTARVAPEGSVVISQAPPAATNAEEHAVDQLAKVLPFRGRAEA